MTLREKLLRLKTENGLTTDALSERSGVPKGTINKLLNGETRNPTTQTLRRLADAVMHTCGGRCAVFSPADGKIVVIEEVDEPKVMGGKCIQLSVYMNFYNVHVNWHPVSGEIIYKDHYNGAFLFASNPKSSSENEHTTIGVRTKSGVTIMFRQIAGWVARRIVSYPEVGDQVEQNHKAGFIKFGSRVDVFVPLGSEICVGIGDKVVGSQTVLAKLPTENL